MQRQHGISTLQVMVSAAIFATVLMASVTYSMSLSTRFEALRSSAASASVATGIVTAIERSLYQARPTVPAAFLLVDLGPGDGSVTLDQVTGLPPRGALLVRGVGGTERVAYDGVSAAGAAWTLSLTSSVSGTHLAGTKVSLAEIGTVDASVTALDTGHFGQTADLTGVREFLGRGSAVVFRTRLADGSFGAVLDGAPMTGAWQMLAFEPDTTLDEAVVDRDLNGDGDRTDRFDVGRVLRWTWAPHGTAGGALSALAVTPRVLVQEQGAWGGDLDGDGSDDPLFVLDPASGVLRMTGFCLDGEGRSVRLTRLQSTVRMRTEP